MFIQVNDQRGKPIDRCRVVLACIGLNNPDGSPQSDDKVTREGGNVAWSWYPTGPGFPAPSVTEFELRVNTYEPLAAFTNETRRVSKAQLENEQQIFALKDTGTPIPPQPSGPITGFGTCAEWKAAVFSIFAKHGFSTVGPDNEGQGVNQAPHLRATIAEIKALYSGTHAAYVQWQYESVGNPPELRPRLFLPHPGGDQFERYADIGDWNMPLKWEHCQ